MEKLLISGNGKGNPSVTSWAAVHVVLIIITAVIFIGVLPGQLREEANSLKQTRTTNAWGMDFGAAGRRDSKASELEEQANMVVTSGVIGIIICIISAALFCNAVAKTKIDVYEDRIEGSGVGKGFLWGDPRRFNFRLAYNQVTSTITEKTAIILHTAGAQYKCYVGNVDEIQDTIFNQQKVAAGSNVATA